MASLGRATAASAPRRLPALDAARPLLAYMLTVDAAALIWAAVAVSAVHHNARHWAVFGLLAVLAIAFEEGSRHAARLQIRLSSQLRVDMSSVWAVAGAAALEPGMSVLLLAVVLIYAYYRQWRPAGEPLYRKYFVSSTIVLASLVGGIVSRSLAANVDQLPLALSGAIPILAAIAVFTVVNRSLVTVVLMMAKVPVRAMFGTMHDNLIELATLCLGGLVAIAVGYEPWLALLVIAPMVTLQRGALVRDLEAAAMTDAKTGLLNALAWEHLATRELARGEREGKPVSVIIIDVDRFKRVNDRFGHLAGDRVLLGLGRSMVSSLREYDGVGRFGGEEFVAVLPDADEPTALVIAERVRARINELTLADLTGDLEAGAETVSVSVGVACTPTDGLELSDLLRAADAALYRAKADGRNRVQLAWRGAGGFEREYVEA